MAPVFNESETEIAGTLMMSTAQIMMSVRAMFALFSSQTLKGLQQVIPHPFKTWHVI